MAMGGLMAVTGEPGRPPLRVAGDQAYHLAGCYAAYGIVLALFQRLATGSGRQVDISLQEAVAAVIPESGISGYLFRGTRVERAGPSRQSIFPYGIFRASDGYVSIAGITMPFWDNIAAWVAEETGDPTITDEAFRVPSSQRAEFADLLTALIEQVTTRYTMEELYQEGQRRRFPIAPVNTPGTLIDDLQLRQRGFFVEVEHPAAGALTYPGEPYAFGESPWRIRRPAPRLGEHNGEIYEGELGLSRAELSALMASGAI
jgi:crotonobetainyl-CoA:carnitine CoA-transferase CaiB-like acyl-CoA transferase